MNISEFIFEGVLETFYLGAKISESDSRLILVSSQDGDIPAIYQFQYGKIFAFIEALDFVVVKICIDFSYFPEKEFSIVTNKHNKFRLGYKTSQKKLIAFLKKNSILYSISNKEFFNWDNHSNIIKLEGAKMNFLFSGENLKLLCKVFLIDASSYR